MRIDASATLPGSPDPWAPSDMPRLRAQPPYFMSEMIAAEPALAERLVRRLARADVVAALATALRAAADARRSIITTGCGTSEHAAMAVARILDEVLRLPTGREVRTTQALDLIDSPPPEGVVIGISHEGGTWATNQALRAARAAGAVTAVIAVSRQSPAADLVDHVVETSEADQSWCHTVGYLSPLLAGTVLASILARRRSDAIALRAMLEAATDPRAASATAAALRDCARVLVVGAGIDEASARELALKIEEGARLAAVAHHLETVRHGHLASADTTTGLVLILSDTHLGSSVVDRAVAVLRSAAELGLPAAAILGTRAAEALPRRLTPAGRMAIPRGSRIAAVAAAALGAAIPLQLLAERLARARGVNPDTLGREDPAQAAAHA